MSVFGGWWLCSFLFLYLCLPVCLSESLPPGPFFPLPSLAVIGQLPRPPACWEFWKPWRETGWGRGDSTYPRQWQPVITGIKGF